MILTKLRIRNFGKLKELEIPLEDQLNIIYGANEAGKSTILAFLKAMFYGLKSQKRDLRENDRLRFQPWDGEFGEGEIYFLNEQGRELLLRRKLGNRRRDNWTIIDALTGQVVEEGDAFAEPGEKILGLGEGAYSRTIYIPQLGSAVSPDKEDEIMARLMNLQETGEEQVSLQMALHNIEKERKRLTLRSGNGKLDSLCFLRAELLEEKKQAELLHEETIKDQLSLNDLLVKKDDLEKLLAELEAQKQALKNYEQCLEYQELQKQAVLLEKWQAELAGLEEQLVCGSWPVDAAFLQESEKMLNDWRQKSSLAHEKEEELTKKNSVLTELETHLGSFPGFADLPEDIEMQLLLREQEEKVCQDVLQGIARLQQEIEELEQEIAAKKAEMGPMVHFYELTAEEEKAIRDKEELKGVLEEQIKHDRQIHVLRRDVLLDEFKRAKNNLLLGSLLALGSILLGIFVFPLAYLFALLGVLVAGHAYRQYKKNKANLAEIEAQLEASDEHGSARDDLAVLEAELQAFYRRFGAFDRQDYLECRRIFTSLRGELEVLQAKVAERRERLGQEKEEEVRQQLAQGQEFITALLQKTRCVSTTEFRDKLAEYRVQKNKRDSLIRERTDLELRLNELRAVKEEAVRKLAERLNFFDNKKGECSENVEIETVEQLLQNYRSLLDQKTELQIRLSTEQNNFEKSLAGRDLASLAPSVEAACSEEEGRKEFSPVAFPKEKIAEEKERLETKLKEFREERLNIEKKVVSLETAIKNRLQDVRELPRIEEELAEAEQQIGKYKEIVEVLDLIKELLQESFQQLQKSFGPDLNKKVGQILQGITAGRHGEVKVAENYRISLKDQHDSIRDLQFFSNGTLDQVYFALRLGIIDLAYNKERKLPLLLDDAFTQYDDQRLAATLNYLLAYAKEHQVLLFTCHRREAEILVGKRFHYLAI